MGIQVEHLTKIYGSGENEVHALQDVSLTIEDGEFIAIIGASGSGKSTLLHMIGGVDKADSGTIYVNDVCITSLKDNEMTKFRREHIGIIYQFYNLIPVLNVVENIELPMQLGKKKVSSEEMDAILNMLDLSDRKLHLPSQLSGGQQQRTAIARCLVAHPDVILADEPTGNLDSKNSEEVMKHLIAINQQQKQTIVMVTHDMELAKKATRILEMADGRIIQEIKQAG